MSIPSIENGEPEGIKRKLPIGRGIIGLLWKRIDKFEEKIDTQQTSIQTIEKKVFNGFGVEISNLVKSVERMEISMGHLWIFVAGSLVTIFVALIAILGSIWLHDRDDQRALHAMENRHEQVNEVQNDAFSDTQRTIGTLSKSR
jgi:hypothetical protein